VLRFHVLVSSALLSGALLLIPGTGETASAPSATTRAPSVSPDDAPPPAQDVRLPLSLERRVGDLGEMVKRRAIRALVVIDPIGFFYEGGLPRGINFEALRDFESFANDKLKTGVVKIEVTFLPVRVDQLEAALTEGIGDIIAYPVTITPEREQRVAFSTPIRTDVTQIVVTGSELDGVSTFEGLGGREVYVNPLTVYYQNLQRVNDSLRTSGRMPIVIKSADKNLSNDDLVQMVNAAMIPATVTTEVRAELWSAVLDNVKPHPELVIGRGARVAWVMRKDNPRLKAAGVWKEGYDGRYLTVAGSLGPNVSATMARARSGSTPLAIWQGVTSASTRCGSSQCRYFLNLSSNSTPRARANTVR
jgi:ABC-type amino acid transport substrate-binding protein